MDADALLVTLHEEANIAFAKFLKDTGRIDTDTSWWKIFFRKGFYDGMMWAAKVIKEECDLQVKELDSQQQKEPDHGTSNGG